MGYGSRCISFSVAASVERIAVNNSFPKHLCSCDEVITRIWPHFTFDRFSMLEGNGNYLGESGWQRMVLTKVAVESQFMKRSEIEKNG